MVAMGWEALSLWGEAAGQVERLTGGVANDVWRVDIGGHRFVGRLGRRSDADIEWEARLLLHLSAAGLDVPVPLPALDGRLTAGGLLVMSYVEGRPPQSPADWAQVARTLGRVHDLTRDWPQRPGWRGSGDLLTEATGTRIDLNRMPEEAVVRCRAAWARLEGRDRSVVHGDPNARNVLITARGVGLIDWDEAHVDVPDLDLGALPGNPAGLDPVRLDEAKQASAAWEAAVCWKDEFAERRLTEVRPV